MLEERPKRRLNRPQSSLLRKISNSRRYSENKMPFKGSKNVKITV
jgi:hypothetical protein